MRARAKAAAFVAVMAFGSAACGDDGNDGAPATSAPTSLASTTTQLPSTSTDATDPPESSAPTTSPVPTPAPVNDVQVQLAEIARAASPTAMATRTATPLLYIAEKAGRVRALDPATGSLGDPLVDITGEVASTGERGLLGLDFSPDGSHLYISYTNRSGDSRVEEIAMAGDAADMSTRRTLFAIDQPAANHNGGQISFGPDGMFWYGLGDGGGSGDRFENAQNLDTLLGAILRVDVTGRDAGEYSIPADNPFVGGGGRPEIWLYGVRNPWRFSFDRATGDLWIGDVGQNAVEEVNVLRAPERGRGANLQWPFLEGFRRFRGDAPAGSVGPIHDYGRSDGSCSITGGYVYRGEAIPALRGVYVFGDYCEGSIRGLFSTADGGVEARKFDARVGNLSSFGEDAAGELYTLSLDGTISRVVAA